MERCEDPDGMGTEETFFMVILMNNDTNNIGYKNMEGRISRDKILKGKCI